MSSPMPDAHARSKGRDPEADGDEVKEEGESQNSAYNNEGGEK